MPTFVTELLRLYHGIGPVSPTVDYVSKDIDYLVSAGLGPIAYSVLTPVRNSVDPAASSILVSANLTAQVIYKQLHRATVEILERAETKGIEVTLLKGISISEAIYGVPHHRVMGDLDLLVRAEDADRFSQLVNSLGYAPVERNASNSPVVPHHHLPELRHAKTGVPIEIHRALVSGPPLANETINGPSAYLAETVSSTFDGLPCRRFSAEYQIVHTVTHWAVDGKWGVNVISINDLLHLVRLQDDPPNWKKIAAWMQDFPNFAEMLAVILLYFADHGLFKVPAELDTALSRTTRTMGKVNLRVLHWLLETFPLSGRRKVGWVLTQPNARTVWLTLLQPRPKFLRLPLAISRVLFRHHRGKTFLSSLPGRIRTLFQPND